ncbi:hypothetical protein L1049_019164 [Liquidambar formosana]|uniref:Phospholipase A2 family protein n=1 Tax=Liquidambar formosana TaxID=63359 RepID=A0AAP0RB45_LIQFO
MNFGFLSNTPWFWAQSNKDFGTSLKSTDALMEQPKQKAFFDIKLWGWSLLSVVPWAINARDKIRTPPTINRDLKSRVRPRRVVDATGSSPLRFRPYVSKVPWHTGARAFLSQFFPRYGHYCGPNWSSGKDGGSLLWDKRPIDWLDFCCYCHDIGYDTHDQAKLLKADLAFLECLERPQMSTKGDAHIAHMYKTMCITGMASILTLFCSIFAFYYSNTKIICYFYWVIVFLMRFYL